MSNREVGKVAAITYDADHGDPPIVYLMIEWRCCSQGFGGLCLDEATRMDFDRQLCDLFEVKRLEDIVGLDCTALWPRNQHSDHMEGLERDGRRFTITGFRRKHWPDKVPSPDETFLAALEEGYTDWEHAPL